MHCTLPCIPSKQDIQRNLSTRVAQEVPEAKRSNHEHAWECFHFQTYMSISWILWLESDLHDTFAGVKVLDVLEVDPDAGHVVILAVAVFIPDGHDQTLPHEVGQGHLTWSQ